MATYHRTQFIIRERFGFVAKTCWIAHVLDLSGKEMRQAPNRIAADARVHACPNHRRNHVAAVLGELGMLGPKPIPVWSGELPT